MAKAVIYPSRPNTDVFPSATLKLNGGTIMQYNQPSFMETHSQPIIGYSGAVQSGGTYVPSYPVYSQAYYPSTFYKRN
jgi:hypothetical protein